jgi:hypothetical protein
MATNNLLETFKRKLAKNLYSPGGSFVNLSENNSEYIKGKTVNAPQSGARPATNINPTTKLTPAKRVDSNITYQANHFITDPTWLDNPEEFWTKYSKRSDVMQDHQDTLQELVENTTIV